MVLLSAGYKLSRKQAVDWCSNHGIEATFVVPAGAVSIWLTQRKIDTMFHGCFYDGDFIYLVTTHHQNDPTQGRIAYDKIIVDEHAREIKEQLGLVDAEFVTVADVFRKWGLECKRFIYLVLTVLNWLYKNAICVRSSEFYTCYTDNKPNCNLDIRAGSFAHSVLWHF